MPHHPPRRAGEAERAHEYVAAWGRAIGDNPRASLDYARAMATLLSFQGQPAPAVEVLQRAERSAASLDLPSERWQIFAALARALRWRQPAMLPLPGRPAARRGLSSAVWPPPWPTRQRARPT